MRYRLMFGSSSFTVYDHMRNKTRGTFHDYDDALDFIALLNQKNEPPLIPPVAVPVVTKVLRARLVVCNSCHAYNEVTRAQCHVCGETLPRDDDNDE